MTSRLALALCLLWAASPTLAAPPHTGTPSARLDSLPLREWVGPSQERGLQLVIPRLPDEAALARFSPEEAHTFIEALESAFLAQVPADIPMAGALAPAASHRLAPLEERVRTNYLRLYGSPSQPLTSSLEHSRWFRALRLSPRFMPEGVREAALALFTSPTTAYSLADRKSTRLNSSNSGESRMPSSA